MDSHMLLTAVAQGKLKLVRLLTEGGTEVDFKGYDGKTPLSIACSFLLGSIENDTMMSIVRLLLKHGANPNAQDMHGRTPLMYVLRHRTAENVIHMLLEHGGDPNITDRHGRDATRFIHFNSIPKYYKLLKKYLKTESRDNLKQRIQRAKTDQDEYIFRRYSDQSEEKTDGKVNQTNQRRSADMTKANLGLMDCSSHRDSPMDNPLKRPEEFGIKTTIPSNVPLVTPVNKLEKESIHRQNKPEIKSENSEVLDAKKEEATPKPSYLKIRTCHASKVYDLQLSRCDENFLRYGIIRRLAKLPPIS